MKSLLKSFVYAFNGIITAVKTQRNLRIHIAAVIYVTAFSFFYEFTKIEYSILILVYLIVISLELVNTALESVVDLCSPEYNKLAEIAKNCASGAVLIAAIGAVIIGVFLFGDISILKKILFYYCNNQMASIGLLFSIIIFVWFIFYPEYKMKGKNNGNKN